MSSTQMMLKSIVNMLDNRMLQRDIVPVLTASYPPPEGKRFFNPQGYFAGRIQLAAKVRRMPRIVRLNLDNLTTRRLEVLWEAYRLDMQDGLTQDYSRRFWKVWDNA